MTITNSTKQSAYFPRKFLTDFFKFVKSNSNEISVITYDDLCWCDNDSYETNYINEYKAWNTAVKKGILDKDKAYILIQYDVDARPERTIELLQSVEHENVPANIMIFNRRIDREKLKTDGVIQYTDYPLETGFLQQLESRKFVIGYHSNAVEQALFNMDLAIEIFNQDIEELSNNYKVNYFSAHGGVVGSRGEKNRHMPLPESMWERIKWVHNGHTARFNASISDGGHNSQKIDPKNRDIRDFVRKMKPGNRYRILIHPQYYSENPYASDSFRGTPWYDELLVKSEKTADISSWDDVKLSWTNN